MAPGSVETPPERVDERPGWWWRSGGGRARATRFAAATSGEGWIAVVGGGGMGDMYRGAQNSVQRYLGPMPRCSSGWRWDAQTTEPSQNPPLLTRKGSFPTLISVTMASSYWQWSAPGDRSEHKRRCAPASPLSWTGPRHPQSPAVPRPGLNPRKPWGRTDWPWTAAGELEERRAGSEDSRITVLASPFLDPSPGSLWGRRGLVLS